MPRVLLLFYKAYTPALLYDAPTSSTARRRLALSIASQPRRRQTLSAGARASICGGTMRGCAMRGGGGERGRGERGRDESGRDESGRYERGGGGGG